MNWKNIIKMSILPKAICRFNSIQFNWYYKNTNGISHNTITNNPKIYMEQQKNPVAKAILRKKNKVGSIMLPDFKLYHKAIVIKTAWYWHKNRHID